MTDPTISLQVGRGVTPVENPLDQAGKALSIKGMMQDQQAGALGLQEKQRQVTEGQQLRELFKTTPDLQTALPKVFGINPQLGISMQKSLHEQQKAALDTKESELKVNAGKAARFGAIAGTIKDEASFHSGIATALDEKLIDPTHAAGLLANGWNDETLAQVQQIVTGAISAKDQHAAGLADLKNEREALEAKHKAELHPLTMQNTQGEIDTRNAARPGVAAQSTSHVLQAGAQTLAAVTDQPSYDAWRQQNPEIAKQLPPVWNAAAIPAMGQQLGMTPDQQVTTAQTAATAVETKNFHRQTIGQGQQRIGIASQANQIRAAEADPYGQLGVNKKPIGGSDLHGPEYLTTLPSLLAAKVKAVANGDQPMPVSRGGQLKGEGKAISDAVYQFDPSFNTQRATVRSDFSPAGKSGKNIQALNTATVHLDQLGEAAKALDNGSFRPGNAAFNGLVTLFGGEAPTNFAGIRAAVASEMATALKGSATDQVIHAIQATIEGASSPKALAGIVNTNLHTLGAKLNTKSEEFQKAIPGDTGYTPILPTASKVFEKHGIKPIAGGGGTVRYTSGGTTYNIPAADEAEFLKDHRGATKGK